MLCSELGLADTKKRVRVLAMLSIASNAYANCAHGDPSDPSPNTLSAIMSDKERFYGIYYINSTTFTYDDPPILKARFETDMTSTELLQLIRTLNPTIDKVLAFHNGTGPKLSNTDLWSQAPSQLNNLYMTFPVFSLGDFVPRSSFVHETDMTQMRIDGGTLLDRNILTADSVSIRAMALITQSLTTGEPQVLSNTWKQQVVFNPHSLFNTTTTTTYLSVSNITDPLMREAVKHVDLKALKTPGYHRSTSFPYRGAPALVSAWVYTNANGLSVPLVAASPHYAVAGPYMTIKKACTALVVVAILLATVLFYFAIDRYLSRPLREVTAAMEASVERGVRQPVRGAACDVVQLAETRELTCAYNAAMAQLRVVDAFVPDAVRATRRGGPSLREHYLTVVTVRVRAGNGAGGAGGAAYGGDVGVDTSALLRRHPGAGAGGVSGDRGRRGGGGLAALVNAVAEAATALTNSGPFASAASLSAFVAAVRELCEARGGTVHRAAPDECVLHFAANVRRVLSGSGAGSGGDAGAATSTAGSPPTAAVEHAADADARAGVECALCVSRWVEQQQQQQQRGNNNNNSSNSGCVEAVPDVRVVVDSGVFVCGEYRAPGSEQTLCVALGRDVAGAVGHVPAAIGVRVAVTGEAALRVRGSAGGGTAAAPAAACSSPPPFPPAAAERGGFRVLPVEVLRTGRAGLDGGAVTLYEVLPGAVDGDAAWLAYARCCVDGFECMVRGDYAGALRAYRGVGEIGDLEPGLLPRCLSREAAHSDAVGGAVSVQVARLMRECERRVRAGSTASYERGRHVPLGIDAVLGVVPPSPAATYALTTKECSRGRRSSVNNSSGRSADAKEVVALRRHRSWCVFRYVVSVNTNQGRVRRAIGGLPSVIRDNKGLQWRLPLTLNRARDCEMGVRLFTALGSAGTLCSVSTLPLREGSGMFRKVMDAAPDGPMSDILRSALPVWAVSARTRRDLHQLYMRHTAVDHPNILQALSYSLDVEGRVVVFWKFCPLGTMRDIIRTYSYLSPITLMRLGMGVLSGLSCLHSRGLVDGNLSLDTVNVGTDGVGRLISRYTDYEQDQKLFLAVWGCYVSPQMAAGNPPTPACDMFCYGLACLECLSRGPAWTWASVPEGSAPHGTQEELKTLMAEGGQAFSAAVVDGRVVPNMAVLESPRVIELHGVVVGDTVRRLLSYTPSERPTVEEVLAICRAVLGTK